jgi:hypothetical protein
MIGLPTRPGLDEIPCHIGEVGFMKQTQRHSSRKGMDVHYLAASRVRWAAS